MGARVRSAEELEGIAAKIMDGLRPELLTVGQIKAVAENLFKMTDCIVLREHVDKKE